MGDATNICWRDDGWLAAFPLNATTALDYFALSPFYNHTCNNQLAKLQGLPPGHLLTMPPGLEYVLHDCQEPHLYAICGQYRSSPKVAVVHQMYYILDGAIYQAPTIHSALLSRTTRCQHNIISAFLKMRSDLDPLLKERETQQEEDPAKAEEPPAPKPLTEADKVRFQKIDRIIVHVLQKYPMPQAAKSTGPSHEQGN